MSDTTMTTLDDDVQTAKSPAKAAAKPAGKVSPEAKEAGIGVTRKTITIHAGEGVAGRSDVPVFVNGFGFNIKRGKPVDVPIEVIEVLANAVTTKYEDGQPVDVPRFAFSIHN